MKIILSIIVVLIIVAGIWYFWPKQKIVTLTRSYGENEVEVVVNKKDYIVWRKPDRITDDTLYAYKTYPDGDCQLVYVFENEYPAGKKIAKLRLCQDTIAKFYYLDTGVLVLQTAQCSIEYRKNLLTGEEEINSDQGICQASLITVE